VYQKSSVTAEFYASTELMIIDKVIRPLKLLQVRQCRKCLSRLQKQENIFWKYGGRFMVEELNDFFKIKDVEKYFPGITAYRVRQWCKQKKIRFNKAGNRYILRKSWLNEDLNRMANDNISTDEVKIQNYGKLRRIDV